MDDIPEQHFQLRDLIEERTGLFFRDFQGVEFLANRLRPRLDVCGCASFEDYLQLLPLDGPAAAAEWREVITRLSKPFSNFLRHAEQMRFLIDTAIPQFVADQKPNSLKIWSAGCATGEEPLSIALALSEAGWFDRLSIEIFATDANIMALEKARQGVYWGRNLDAFSRELRDKYFTSSKGGWQAAPEIQDRIRWSMANLVNEFENTEFADAHLIFCQQVFIYFRDETIINTIRSFERHMPVGGYLFTDSGDHYISLVSRNTNLMQQEFEPSSVWRKLK